VVENKNKIYKIRMRYTTSQTHDIVILARTRDFTEDVWMINQKHLMAKDVSFVLQNFTVTLNFHHPICALTRLSGRALIPPFVWFIPSRTFIPIRKMDTSVLVRCTACHEVIIIKKPIMIVTVDNGILDWFVAVRSFGAELDISCIYVC